MFRRIDFASAVVFWSAAVLAGPITSNETSNIAWRMKHNLDITANPCDNFYQFVCGSSNISTPEEKVNLDENPVHKRVEGLIQKGTGSKNFRPFQLIDDVYRTCMSDEAVGEQVVERLPHVFERLGDWPLLEGSRKWRTKDYMWIDFILHSKVIGVTANPFLSIEPFVHPEGGRLTAEFAVTTDPPEFKRSIVNSSDPLLAAYATYVEKACKLIGCQETYSNEIKDIVDLEWKLSEIRLRTGKTYALKELTYKELTEKYSSVFWFKLVNYYYIDYVGHTELNTTDMRFFVSPILSDVIDLLDRTDPRVLSNYACWKVLQHAIPYLTKDYQELKREYCLTQECEDIPRPLFCSEVVQHYLKPAVNLLYAKHYFSKEADSLVSDMVANIKQQVKDLISKSSWMDQDTKKKSIDVMDNTSVFIGYAEKNNTDNDFVEYFEDLEIDTSNFFETLMNLEAFDSERRIYSTNSFGTRNFINPVIVSHPVYSDGKIDIPMAMLQEPFFSVDYPMDVNYGITGKAIAEELVKGILYPQHQSSQAKKDKVACFEEQFKNITSKDAKKPLSYRITQLIGEHLAYKASYQAYQSWLSSSPDGSEPTVPELSYSNRQIFWISSLQNICVRFPEETKIIDDTYAPFEFRMMKAVTSVPEFYDDFDCQRKPFLENYGPSCTYL